MTQTPPFPGYFLVIGFLLFVFVLVGSGIYIKRFFRNKRSQNLRQLVQDLGIQIEEENLQGLGIKGIYGNIKVYLGFLKGPRHRNDIMDVSISITAFFKNPFSYNLRIFREASLMKSIQMIGGVQDIQIGNEIFDKKFIIHVSTEGSAEVRAFLQDFNTQKILINLAEKYNRIFITEKGITIQALYGFLSSNNQEYKIILDDLTSAIKSIKR